MYIWTVRGTKLEDISIIFDNDSLDPISNDLRTIKDRISRRGNRKAKARRRKNVQSKTK